MNTYLITFVPAANRSPLTVQADTFYITEGVYRFTAGNSRVATAQASLVVSVETVPPAAVPPEPKPQ